MEPEAYHELYQLEARHWWYRGMRSITDGLLLTVLDRQDDLHILDAGCGTGMNLSALGRFGHVLGCDFSALALDYARRDHTGVLAQATVESLPYPDDTFDLVTSFDVIYCAEVGDDVAALREMARVSRRYVLIRVPALSALRGAHDAFVHGVRRYTARELEAKFHAAGLIPLRLTYANSFLLPLIFLARRWQLARSEEGRSDVQYNPSLVGELLYRLLKIEGWWIRRGYRFPLGVSLFGLARKLPRGAGADVHGE